MKRINIYGCTKGHNTITRDLDQGTTPMAIQCQAQGCSARAVSRWYNVDQDLTPTHEWFIPTAEARRQLSKAMQQHVLNGGLILRPIEVKEVRKHLVNQMGSVDDIRCSLKNGGHTYDDLVEAYRNESAKESPRLTVLKMLLVKMTQKTKEVQK